MSRRRAHTWHYVAAASSLPLVPLMAIIASRLEAKQLPEVAGERRVEAEHSDKLADSLLLVRHAVVHPDPQIGRCQPRHVDNWPQGPGTRQTIPSTVWVTRFSPSTPGPVISSPGQYFTRPESHFQNYGARGWPRTVDHDPLNLNKHGGK